VRTAQHDAGLDECDPCPCEIPKAITPGQKKLAEELLSRIDGSDEVQRDVFKSAGGIPPNTRVQQVLAKEEPLFAQLKATLIDGPYQVTPAYNFKQWPEVHATFADVAATALSG
jgi:hypothetical protein